MTKSVTEDLHGSTFSSLHPRKQSKNQSTREKLLQHNPYSVLTLCPLLQPSLFGLKQSTKKPSCEAVFFLHLHHIE